MTRGTPYLITSYESWSELINCSEFNGDMYPTGHYEEMVSKLERVEYTPDFYLAMLAFDRWNFNYQNEKSDYFTFHRKVEKHDKAQLVIDFNDDYFEKWFSDYIFIKVKGKDVKFIDRDKKTIVGTNGQVLVFNFGYYMSDEKYKEQTKNYGS